MAENDDLLLISDKLEEGLALLRADRPLDALKTYREILEKLPDQPEALGFAGVAAVRIGDAEQGLAFLQSALLQRPDDPDLLNNLGNALRALERYETAEARYRDAIRHRPDHADAHYNLGIALECQERPDAAEAAYRDCLGIDPQFEPARFGRANVLKSLGRIDEAIEEYGRVLEMSPGHLDARSNLGSALQELGKFQPAAKEYRKVLTAEPGHVEACYNLGIAMQGLEQPEAAIEAYSHVLEIEPGHVGARVNLGCAHQEVGDFETAAAAFRNAILTAPDYAGAYVNLADLYLETGEPKKALLVADDFLGHHPSAPAMLAFKSIVLHELGDGAGARELIDIDRFVRPVRPTPPAEFSDIDAFNKALAGHLLGHPSLVEAPLSHATRDGRHSGELLVEPMGPFAAIAEIVRQEVAGYIDGLAGAHPFIDAAPDQFRISVWGVAMPAGGRQVPHIHPAAWLGGVYYPRVPEVVRTEDEGRAGWIEFGRPPDHLHAKSVPPVRSFQPEEGLMLLFPSYFYHHTVPFDSEETRLSIAFDVLASNVV